MRTQSRHEPHADHIGCEISNSALSRSEPGTSLRNVSPSGVNPKRPAASRVNTPMLARVHKMRLSEGAWQPAANAIWSAVSCPFLMRSAIPKRRDHMQALGNEMSCQHSLHLLNWPALIFLMRNGHKLLLREGRTDLPLFGILYYGQASALTCLPIMSAIGTKRTYRVAPHMSAFGGRADMPFCTAHVCF